MGFVLTGHGGYCANSDQFVLANTATGDGTIGYTRTRLTAARGSVKFTIAGVTAFALQP